MIVTFTSQRAEIYRRLPQTHIDSAEGENTMFPDDQTGKIAACKLAGNLKHQQDVLKPRKQLQHVYPQWQYTLTKINGKHIRVRHF